MKTESDIRSDLILACEQRGEASRIARAFEISPSTVKRWLEGGEIPPSMLILLRLYLYAEIPFGVVRPAPEAHSLTFTAEEARVVHVLATRSGKTVGQWATERIRDYLALLQTQSDATSHTIKPPAPDPPFAGTAQPGQPSPGGKKSRTA